MPAFLAVAELILDCSTAVPSDEDLRVIHVVTGSQELRVVRQSSAFVANVGDVDHACSRRSGAGK